MEGVSLGASVVRRGWKCGSDWLWVWWVGQGVGRLGIGMVVLPRLFEWTSGSGWWGRIGG